MHSESLNTLFPGHMKQVKAIHEKDLADGWGPVSSFLMLLTEGIPNAPKNWRWQVGLSSGTPMDQRQEQGTRTLLHRRIIGTESCQRGRGEGRAYETSHVQYVPPFVCHAPARKRLGHSNRPGAIGASRCQHDDDLYACSSLRAGGCP